MTQPDLFPLLLASALDEMRAAHPYEPAVSEEPLEPFDEEDDLNTDLENLHERDAVEAEAEQRDGHWVTVDESTLVAEDMYHYASES